MTVGTGGVGLVGIGRDDDGPPQIDRRGCEFDRRRGGLAEAPDVLGRRSSDGSNLGSMLWTKGSDS